jgi:hypothetical protein
LHWEIGRLRMDVQRMGETIGRVERDGFDAQIGLQNEVDRLRDQIGGLRGHLMQVQGALGTMLAQSGRSTVGSAGYTWGW